MNDLVNFYASEAQKYRSEVAGLALLQKKAIADFQRDGFPTRRHEEWKYTTAERFLQQPFHRAQAEKATRKPPQIPLIQQVTINNGQIVVHEEIVAATVAKAEIIPLHQALINEENAVLSALAEDKPQHAFQALNIALLNTGLYIRIPRNVHLDKPLCLYFWQDQLQQASYNRLIIDIEEGASAAIIEYFSGEDDCVYTTNTFTNINLAAHSRLVHYKIQQESKTAFHFGHIAVQQHAASSFQSHSFQLGSKLTRSDIEVGLCGEKSQCMLNGVYAPTAGQHIDQHTTIVHHVPGCQSEQDYKGILKGQSRAIFNGKIIVEPNAQQSSAHQQNKNLLLSAQAEIDTKPQLEIHADDVSCSHGATVGQLDEQALFYLASRGIGQQEALQFLIQAFAADNLGLLANAQMAAWLQELIKQQMEIGHG